MEGETATRDAAHVFFHAPMFPFPLLGNTSAIGRRRANQKQQFSLPRLKCCPHAGGGTSIRQPQPIHRNRSRSHRLHYSSSTTTYYHYSPAISTKQTTTFTAFVTYTQQPPTTTRPPVSLPAFWAASTGPHPASGRGRYTQYLALPSQQRPSAALSRRSNPVNPVESWSC